MSSLKLFRVLASKLGESTRIVQRILTRVADHLPLLLAPTTAGTGSEVTPVAILTTANQLKMGIVSPQLYADVAILDPNLTASLPPSISSVTGIDAMIHAIDAYTSKIKKNPISD